MNSELYFFNQILIIGVTQGFIFSLITCYNNRAKDKAILFLNMTILFLTINNFQAWLSENNIEFPYYYIKHLKAPWNIFLAPMFYLFLMNFLRINERIKKFLLYSVLLFVLCLLIRVFLLGYLKPHINTPHFYYIMRRYNSFEDIIIFIFTISIFIYSGLIVFKKKRWFKLISSYDNLKWIRTFFMLSSVVLSFWFIALFLNYYFINIDTSYFYSPLRLGTSFLIYWIGYQGLYQQKVVRNRISIRDMLLKEVSNERGNTELHSGNFIETTNDKHLDQFKEIDKFIRVNKVYTNADLSLESLASSLNLSTSTLSQLINKNSGSNFTDYINAYRVELAKKLLIHNDYQNYTILSIGLESGFNSKSTFYTAFKKFTELTPVAYKRQSR